MKKVEGTQQPVGVDLGFSPESIQLETLEIIEKKGMGFTSLSKSLVLKSCEAAIKIQEAQTALNDLIADQNAYIKDDGVATPTAG